MKTDSAFEQPRGWLDRLAIGMAMLCAVHCLLMPVLIVALPIIATSFFVHEDFHLWMLLFVLPTTGLSIIMGCRKHRDRWTAVLSMIGIGIMIAVTVVESCNHVSQTASAHVCPGCARTPEEPIPPSAWISALGGLFLAVAHARNFRLCRKGHCRH